jgi:uncharacterized protein YdaU (DUF1376 family)
MKNQFKWMPMYWSDEEIVTIELGPLEFGVYALLISYYWRNCGPIPDNDAVLARAARMTVAEFAAVKAPVLHLFEFDDGFWRHPETDAKLKHSRDVSEKASLAANARHHPRGNVLQLSKKKD